jgi:hypothetical protein
MTATLRSAITVTAAFTPTGPIKPGGQPKASTISASVAKRKPLKTAILLALISKVSLEKYQKAFLHE